MGEVVFATIFGIALGQTPPALVFVQAQTIISPVGPSGADIFRPRDWGGSSSGETNDITMEVTRLVIALGVFAIGVG